MRNKKQTCSAAVIKRDNKFQSNSQEHTHAPDPTRCITAKVSLKAKNIATKDFFRSARAIVSEAKSEVTGLTEVEPINEDYLTRVTNRKREQLRPEEPNDLDFEVNVIKKIFLCAIQLYTNYVNECRKKGKRKVQGVPQSQTAALPRHQEEEETEIGTNCTNVRKALRLALSSPSGLKNTITKRHKVRHKTNPRAE